MSEKIETPVALEEPAATPEEVVLAASDELEQGAEGSEAPLEPEQPPAEQQEQAQEQEEEEEPETGAGELLSDEELERATFALIFASPEPLSTRRLAQQLQGPKLARVKAVLGSIAERLAETDMPLELREIAGGWRFLTAADVAETVAGLVKARKAEKLSAAGLETLAVVAYRQPVTKADIESIRGVQCGAMLRNLVDRGLARVTGRADVPGHPLQYGTSKDFLDRFGLGSLSDLPRDGELLKE